MSLWTWESDPNVSQKHCTGCGQLMALDRAMAVKYQDKIWHAHCLLDFLTDYHYNNKKVDSTTSDCGEPLPVWGYAP